MTASFLQATGGFAATAGTTVAATYGSPVTAGNLLVCGIGCDVNATITVSDSVNGAWTAIGTRLTNSALNSQMFYKANTAAGTPTVTATCGSGNYRNLRIGEWGGVATTTPLDANNGTTGSSTTPATTVTTVADHDLVVGTAYITNTAAAGTGFNSRVVTDGNVLEDKLDQTPAGALSVAFTQSPTGLWNAEGAAFLPAAGGAAAPPPTWSPHRMPLGV